MTTVRKRYEEAWCLITSNNLNGLSALANPDFTFIAMEQPHDINGLKTVIANWRDAFSDFGRRHTILSTKVDGNRLEVHHTVTAKQDGALTINGITFQATWREVAIEFTDVFEISPDGKIRRWSMSLNTDVLIQQLTANALMQEDE